MKRFKIINFKHLKPNEGGKVPVFIPLLNKEIVLPYPEFCTQCILITANPIDLVVSENGAVVGEYSDKENLRTCYFLKPYSEGDYYWKNRSLDNEYWIPFFPEQKEVIYAEDGNFFSFFKDISFNNNWQPISHALYVNRVQIAHSEELDYMDINVDKYVVVDSDEYEQSSTEDNYDVYATEFFGEIEDDECYDEVWECAKLLQKEMLFLIEITTEEEGKRKDYVKEVLGLDLKDALDQVFQGEGGIDFSSVTSYRVYHNNELIRHEGSWIKY